MKKTVEQLQKERDCLYVELLDYPYEGTVKNIIRDNLKEKEIELKEAKENAKQKCR